MMTYWPAVFPGCDAFVYAHRRFTILRFFMAQAWDFSFILQVHVDERQIANQSHDTLHRSTSPLVYTLSMHHGLNINIT